MILPLDSQRKLNKVILPTQCKKKSTIILTIVHINFYLLTPLFRFLSTWKESGNRSSLANSPKQFVWGETKTNSKYQIYIKQMTSTNPKSTNFINREDVNEMIENAIRRHNRRSTIISAILGWILIGGYSFGLFHVVQSI